MKNIILSISGFFLMWQNRILAQVGVPDTTSVSGSTDFSGQFAPTLFKLGLALLVIIVLIYLSVMMLKRLSAVKMGKKALSGTINVLDRHFIAPKKQLCLVNVQDKYYLVGVTDQAVNLVADVSDQEFDKPQTVSKPDPQKFSFKHFLNAARQNLPMFANQVENPQKS